MRLLHVTSIIAFVLLLIVGCDSVSRTQIVPLNVTLTPNLNLVPSIVNPSPTAQSGSQYKLDCLNIVPSEDIESKGMVILENRRLQEGGGRYERGDFLLDMETDNILPINSQNENQIYHIVSPNKELMAYHSVLFDNDGKTIQSDLVIADAMDNQIKSIPWETGWVGLPAWLDNENLIINNSAADPDENASQKPATMLVLNPFSESSQILQANFPQYVDIGIVPYWNGWSGVIYDQSLSRAIYPVLIGDDGTYTYGVWDLNNKKLLFSLESIFSGNALFGDLYPMPIWSPDGMQFVVKGRIVESDNLVVELYSVGKNGKITQLTHLTSNASSGESNFSWSPDGRYIAMFIDSKNSLNSKMKTVAVLDTTTLNLTNYCLQVVFRGNEYGYLEPPTPIWSPNSTQFLVEDWYEKDHRRKILVDIKNKSAAYIADDMEARGWMKNP